MKVTGTARTEAPAGPGAAQLLESFRRYLREHNLPVTAQREQVADVIFGSPGHLSADDIERTLRARGANVGKATVYRTLDLLSQSGMVSTRDFGEGFKRYERAPGRSHHEHLICIRCNRVIEFVNERLERMKALIAEEYGFRHHHHRLEIFGTCPECQQREAFAPVSPSGPR
jgi:Fur family ferric uptake transcriptional regulator